MISYPYPLPPHNPYPSILISVQQCQQEALKIWVMIPAKDLSSLVNLIPISTKSHWTHLLLQVERLEESIPKPRHKKTIQKKCSHSHLKWISILTEGLWIPSANMPEFFYVLGQGCGKACFHSSFTKTKWRLLLANSQTTQQLKPREGRPKFTCLGGI